MTVLAFDPGNSTGWVYKDSLGNFIGGTVVEDHLQVGNIIENLSPSKVVIESFHLYPSKAQSMAWNSFYPCEVIGVIKFVCTKRMIPWVEQAPSVKKYSGITKQSPEWLQFKLLHPEVSEHTFDAFQHLRYFERFGDQKK